MLKEGGGFTWLTLKEALEVFPSLYSDSAKADVDEPVDTNDSILKDKDFIEILQVSCEVLAEDIGPFAKECSPAVVTYLMMNFLG